MSQSMLVAAQFPWAQWASGFSGLGPPCASNCAEATITQQFQPFVCSSATDTTCLCSAYDNAGQVLGDIMSYCILRDCPSPVHVASNAFYNLCNTSSGTVTGATPTATAPFNAASDTGVPANFVPTVTPTPEAAALSYASSAGVSSTPAPHVAFTAPVTGGSNAPYQTSTSVAPSATAAAQTSLPNSAFIFTPGKIAGITVGVVVGLILIFVLAGAGIAKYRSHKKRKPEGYYDVPPMHREPKFGGPSYRFGIPAYEKDLENAIHEKDVKGAPVHEAVAPPDHTVAQEMPASMPVAQEMGDSNKNGQYLPDLKFDTEHSHRGNEGLNPFVTPEDSDERPRADSYPQYPVPESPKPVAVSLQSNTGIINDAPAEAAQSSRKPRFGSLKVLIPDKNKQESSSNSAPPYGPLPPIPAGQSHATHDRDISYTQSAPKRKHQRAHTTDATNSTSSSSYVSPIMSPESEVHFPERSARGSLMRARPAWLQRYTSSASRRRLSMEDGSLLHGSHRNSGTGWQSPKYTQAMGPYVPETVEPVPQRARAQSVQRFLASDMRQVSPFQPESSRAQPPQQPPTGHLNDEAQQLLRLGLRNSTMTSAPAK